MIGPAVAQLVDNLGIGEFRILAISGGAPYAYATAIAMPDRVRAIAIAGGVIPFAELKDFKGLLPLYRWMLAFYRNRPQLLRQLFRLARPFLSFRAPVRLRPLLLKMLLLRPCDAASLRDDAAFEAIFESQRRAWRGSAEGVMIDAQIYAQPWGFGVQDVRVPVRLWHGIEDRAFAVRLAEEIANRFPDCKARFIPKRRTLFAADSPYARNSRGFDVCLTEISRQGVMRINSSETCLSYPMEGGSSADAGSRFGSLFHSRVWRETILKSARSLESIILSNEKCSIA